MNGKGGSHSSDLIITRLHRRAREKDRPYAEILQYYGMERFLYRVSQSSYADNFVLKGALMLAVFDIPEFRATRDIDFLAEIDNSPDKVKSVFREICRLDYQPDGVRFEVDTIRSERIVENGIYQGLRVKFTAYLGNSRIPIQIDIGIGDVVHPRPEIIEYPTILDDMPPPRLRGYSRESIIAEKFHTMVKLSLKNSRVKDFYDIWILSRQYDFDGKVLAAAIEKTFDRRSTELPVEPYSFLDDYYDDPSRDRYWKGFLTKNNIHHIPTDFKTIIDEIAEFILPVIESRSSGTTPIKIWKAPGPWR